MKNIEGKWNSLISNTNKEQEVIILNNLTSFFKRKSVSFNLLVTDEHGGKITLPADTVESMPALIGSTTERVIVVATIDFDNKSFTSKEWTPLNNQNIFILFRE